VESVDHATQTAGDRPVSELEPSLEDMSAAQDTYHTTRRRFIHTVRQSNHPARRSQ
jgi:hypothetical protein